MRSEEKDSSDQYWQIESCNLQKAFDRKIRDLIESGEAHHFSIFAFAPQPLLIQLRKLFTDRVHATVYQLHRETRTWQWQPHPNGFAFNTTEPEDKSGIPVLAFSSSAKIAPERISTVFPGKLSSQQMLTSLR